MGRLAGKNVIITGGANGIGRQCAELFCREGAKVAIFDIAAGGEAVVEAIRYAGGEAIFLKTDITEQAEVARAMSAVIDTLGGIDVLYNNAGGSSINDGPLTTCPDEEFWRTIKLDLYGTWLCCRHAIPAMVKAGGGSIINTTSGIVSRGGAGRNAYSAAKGGVASLTRSMAVEFAPDKIRVNAIAPGGVATERILSIIKQSESARALIQDNALLGMVEPIDIANIALYLASDESRVTTGQMLAVDSGYLA
jgi:NAD(P)-dependent dehydrogenase (short-subunit alcohol dehydrogenase family)